MPHYDMYVAIYAPNGDLITSGKYERTMPTQTDAILDVVADLTMSHSYASWAARQKQLIRYKVEAVVNGKAARPMHLKRINTHTIHR